jgi:hypothetical protein
MHGPRWIGLMAAVGGVLLAAAGEPAAQSSAPVTAETGEIGRVETGIERYDHALGVVTGLRRPSGAETECYGICFYASSSRAVGWRCAPQENCQLHCAVNPPVGGCR